MKTTVKCFGLVVLFALGSTALRAQWTFQEQNRWQEPELGIPTSTIAIDRTDPSDSDEEVEDVANYLPLERNLFGAEVEYELPLRQSAGYFVEDHRATSDLSVFATRDFEEIYLSVEVQRSQPLEIQIRNATGKVVAQDHYALKRGSNHLAVSTQSLTPGVYLLEVRSADVHLQERFVMQ